MQLDDVCATSLDLRRAEPSGLSVWPGHLLLRHQEYRGPTGAQGKVDSQSTKRISSGNRYGIRVTGFLVGLITTTSETMVTIYLCVVKIQRMVRIYLSVFKMQ